jgi:16S rRNA (cytidine1402-2'-O)-methyltransferase
LSMTAEVYLIPVPIAEDGFHTIPRDVLGVINRCEVFFAEDLRTARRAFRKIDPKFNIDSKTWHEIKQEETAYEAEFKAAITDKKIIGIVSESGCPGIADPGQKLVAWAHEAGTIVKPVSGPSSLLLALMASGLNGQQFTFNGYLPIASQDRTKKIRELEKKVITENCSQLFIETPYRNQQLFDSLLETLQPSMKLCVAFNLTSASEWVKTMTIGAWKKKPASLPKAPAIFIIGN